ncbi:MAG: DUF493 domain-containing protein [Phycisphaerales bacterium]|jgi:uncharacterized protein|nr:DUF493 domain-containing protein [Phycisphaerales bacterium]MBT7170900.1 DUF493 domain-containing protein [Phycisphaerales bacterium]
MIAPPTHSGKIDYPCMWQFRLIGSDLAALQRCVVELVGHRPHTSQPANASSGGKFVSLNLSMKVQTAEDRDAVFLALKSHPAVKVVL